MSSTHRAGAQSTLRLSGDGIWISSKLESTGRCKSRSWGNGDIKPIITPLSTRKELRHIWHAKRLKLKIFNPGDKELLFSSRVKLFGNGRSRSKWLGLYLVIDTSTHGAITI